ncbi:hypothetical protein NEAUS04_1941 [Nematocida ausubeli]|nr:hypothetical protein NEAUS04_1941 [Nematocida ausubeli]
MSEKKFRIALEKQLELFRTANDWSDLVAYLTGLEGILRVNKYTHIPRPHLLYRRLNQCLNPALPAGVHMKALGVYKIVMPKLSQVSLLQEIDVLTLGLFGFYSHSNLTSIPSYLAVLKQIIEVLGDKTINICKKMILGMIMGLEEENSEQYGMTLQVLNILEEKVGAKTVLVNTWEAMGQCTELVPGCLMYILRVDKGLEVMRGRSDMLSKGFVSALKSKEIITLRKSFDLLLSYKTDGLDLHPYNEDVSLSVLKLLLLKEISLLKRVQMWITLLIKQPDGIDLIFASICMLFDESPSACFKILMAIRQNIEESPEIFKRLILWILSVIDVENEVYASAFFKILDKRIIWEIFLAAPLDMELIKTAIRYNLIDEHTQTTELPLLITRCIKSKIYPYEWLDIIQPVDSAYSLIWDEIKAHLEGREINRLQPILFFLSIPVTAKLLDTYTSAVKTIGKVFLEYWSCRENSKKVHAMITDSLTKIVVPCELSEEECTILYEAAVLDADTFWAYDEIFNGKLQSLLQKRIIYQGTRVRPSLDQSAELSQAFSLVDQCKTSKVSAHFLCFLISFCSSRSYAVRQKAINLCRKVNENAQIFTEIFESLNWPCERQIEETIFLVDCDYNRVLFGLQILDSMLEHSCSFRAFLRNHQEIPEMKVAEISDLSGYYASDAPVCPASVILHLLLMYATAEFTNSKIMDGLPYIEQAENNSCLALNIQEIKETSLRLLKELVCTDFSSVLFSLHTSPAAAILQSVTTRHSIPHALDIFFLLKSDQETSDLLEIFMQRENIRTEIIIYCVKQKKSSVLLDLLEFISGLIKDFDKEEAADNNRWNIHHIQYILQHCIYMGASGLKSTCSNDQSIPAWPEKGEYVCYCGMEFSDVFADGGMDRISHILLKTYAVIYSRLSALKLNAAESVAAEEYECENNLEILSRYVLVVHSKSPGILAEAILSEYLENRQIQFISIIEKTIEQQVFLHMLGSDLKGKYKLLREWAEYTKNESIFMSSQVHTHIATILAQVKMYPKTSDLLWFCSAYLKSTSSAAGTSLGNKVLESSVVSASKLGIKKTLPDKIDNTSDMLDLLNIIDTIIITAVKRVYSLDTSAIWSMLILPCYRLPVNNALYSKSLEITRSLVKLPESKTCRRDFYEQILSERFFKDTLPNIHIKVHIGAYLIDCDRVQDLINRANTTSFFIRESDIISRASLIKRVRYMILCAPKDEYTQNLPGIFSLISEIFAVSSGSKILLVETFHLCRVLCIKMPIDALINMWPISISEAMDTLSSELVTSANASVGYAALQFLDLVASLNYPELIEFRWLVEGLPHALGYTEEAAPDTNQSDATGRITHRRPCILAPAEETKESLISAIHQVANHHMQQRNCTQMDHAAIINSVVNGIPE